MPFFSRYRARALGNWQYSTIYSFPKKLAILCFQRYRHRRLGICASPKLRPRFQLRHSLRIYPAYVLHHQRPPVSSALSEPYSVGLGFRCREPQLSWSDGQDKWMIVRDTTKRLLEHSKCYQATKLVYESKALVPKIHVCSGWPPPVGKRLVVYERPIQSKPAQHSKVLQPGKWAGFVPLVSRSRTSGDDSGGFEKTCLHPGDIRT